MLLRIKIFRHLVIFALIPSIALAGVAYYMIVRAIGQTGSWLASGSPDRTINSLRLLEDYLQQSSQSLLPTVDPEDVAGKRAVLNWMVTIEADSTRIYIDRPFPEESIRTVLSETSGPIRRVVESRLIIGYAEKTDTSLIAGGYILDREYLTGFEAASQSLSESRGYTNILPAFVLFIILAGSVALLVVILSAYYLSRRLSASITTPLERLSGFAQSVARGERPGPLVLAGTEEVENLAETFNRMIADLEQSRRRLMAAERVAAWQEFARRMAHELKNPLTPISISLYRIRGKLEESGDYQRYAEAMEAITAEVDHLQRLAADYSSLAKLPEPKFTLFDFNHLAGEVIELFAAQLDRYEFENRISGDIDNIQADPDRLREVMVNLLKNAIAFAPDGGKITVAGDCENKRLRFSVVNENRDEKITDDDLRSAKLPYYSTREGGSGLGLAVSEKIIIDHDGTLTLRLDGNMTEARFDIPVGRKQSGDSL